VKEGSHGHRIVEEATRVREREREAPLCQSPCSARVQERVRWREALEEREREAREREREAPVRALCLVWGGALRSAQLRERKVRMEVRV
jgi:hypothetical protein